MASLRLYAHRTPVIERALALAPSALPGIGEKASAPKRLEAWVAYGVERWEEEQALEERLLAYEELAAVPGRHDRLKRNTREAAKHGLL